MHIDQRNVQSQSKCRCSLFTASSESKNFICQVISLGVILRVIPLPIELRKDKAKTKPQEFLQWDEKRKFMNATLSKFLFLQKLEVRDQKLQYECSEFYLTEAHVPTFPSLPSLLL